MRRAVSRPVSRPVNCRVMAVALGVVLALAGCGSVTGRHTDGGGGGGTHADSSTKLDGAPDHPAADARLDSHQSHDSGSAKDMSVADARMSDARGRDAVSNGGSGGTSGGGTSGGGTSGGGTSGGGTSGGGGAGGSPGGECQSNSDCTLYAGAGSGCCGVCQPKTDPAPPPVQCLIACLTPLVTCGCTNQQCVGSKKQL